MTKTPITISARLVSMPTMRLSKQGKPWASARIATGEGDSTQFFGLVAFGEHAERIEGKRKGTAVKVVGHLEDDSWTDKTGTLRQESKIVADSVLLDDLIAELEAYQAQQAATA